MLAPGSSMVKPACGIRPCLPIGLPSRTEKAARERIHPVRKGLCSIAIAVALGAAVFLSRGDVAFGQTPGSSPSVDELRERIERLEKQNQELLKTLQGLQPRPRPAAPASEVDHESVSQQVDRESSSRSSTTHSRSATKRPRRSKPRRRLRRRPRASSSARTSA